MVKNKNLLRSLLTGVSVAAILAGGVANTEAATLHTVAGSPATIAVNNGLGGFVNGDNIKLSADLDVIVSSGEHVVNTVDLDNKINTEWQIGKAIGANNSTVTSIINSGGGGMKITLELGKAFLINGTAALSSTTGGTLVINKAATVVTASDLIKSNVEYLAAGTLTANGSITGDVDFKNNAGILNIGNDQTVTGNVDNTGGAGGTLNFVGNGAVTGDIGKTNKLADIIVQGGVDINNKIYVGLNNEVNAAHIDVKANAIVNVMNQTAASIPIIDIASDSIFAFVNTNMAVNQVSSTQVRFAGPDAALGLASYIGPVIFILHNNIDPGANGGKIVLKSLTVDPNITNSNVTLDADIAGRSLGTAGHKLSKLLVVSAADTAVITGKVDLQHVQLLSVQAPAGLRSFALLNGIGAIEIGLPGVTDLTQPQNIEVNGPSAIIFDAFGGSSNFSAGPNIIFKHDDSSFVFNNSGGAASTITLTANFKSTPNKNILEVKASSGDLIIDGLGFTIGQDATQGFRELIVSGTRSATINPTVFAKNITITNSAVTTFGGAIDTGLGGAISLIGSSGVNFNGGVKSPLITSLNAAPIRTPSILAVDTLTAPNMTLSLDNSSTLTGYIGGAVTNVTVSRIDADDTTISGGTYVTTLNGSGTVTLNNNFNLTGPITGTATSNFDFVKNAKVTGDVGTALSKVGEISVGAGGVLELGGDVNATKLTLTGTTQFTKDATNIRSGFGINGSAASSGKLNFTQGAIINEAIGAANPLAEVNFSSNTGDKVITLNKSITADTIRFAKSAIEVNAGVPVLTGNVSLTDTTLNLAGNDLRLENGTITFNDKVRMNIVVTRDANNDPLSGNLIVNKGSKLILNGVGSLELNITNNAGTNFDGAVETLFIIDGVGATDMSGFDINKVKVVSNNAFTRWKQEIKDGDFVLTNSVDIPGILNNDILVTNTPKERISQKFIDELLNAARGTQAFNVLDELDSITVLGDDLAGSALRVDALTRIENSVNLPVSEISDTTLVAITDKISSRIGGFTTLTPSSGGGGVKVSNGGAVTGVAAGDEPEKYGAWGSPVYSDSTQKTTLTSAGYRAKSVGGTVGFDAKVTEAAIVGGAISMVRTDSKYKGFKSGDKTKMESVLFSIYGMYQLTDKVFAQSVATYSQAKVKNKEHRRISSTQSQIAEGDYTAKSFGVELLAGYNHIISDKFTVTPMVGLDYARSGSNSYTEKGTTNQNFRINKKSHDKWDAIGGVRLSTMYVFGMAEITPEIHGFVRQTLTNKAIKVGIKTVDGSLDLEDSSKPTRTHYNIGVGFNARHGMMEYGVGYDLNIAKKFTSHQGSVKIRVNF